MPLATGVDVALKLGARTIDVNNPALRTLDRFTDLDRALQMFISDRNQRLSPETLKWYQSQVRSYITWLRTNKTKGPSARTRAPRET